eukprot:648411-Prymnesium_polylepis.1
MWKAQRFCDGVVEMEGRTFQVHRAVLACGSEFFARAPGLCRIPGPPPRPSRDSGYRLESRRGVPLYGHLHGEQIFAAPDAGRRGSSSDAGAARGAGSCHRAPHQPLCLH